MRNRIIILILSGIVFLLTELSLSGTLLEFKRTYNAAIIEPISYIALSLAVSMFILLFASTKVVDNWKRSFFVWYAPLSIFVILLGSTSSSFSWPSRADFAVLSGVGLILITFIFVIYNYLRAKNL